MRLLSDLGTTACHLGEDISILFKNILPKKIIQTKIRKPRDTTRFTQYQYDFILWVHNEYIKHNEAVKGIKGKERVTLDTVIKYINTRMGTDKSRTAIAKVWQGKINRDSLAVGDPYFKWTNKKVPGSERNL